MGSVYQIDVKILNRTQLLTSFKYIPPHTENFTIKDIIYPKRDSALIAPGMNARIQVLFHATSMDNFEDDITILTERMKFKIPLKAIRDKPPAKPSKPSVILTALLVPTSKNKINKPYVHFKFIFKPKNDISRVGSPPLII